MANPVNRVLFSGKRGTCPPIAISQLEPRSFLLDKIARRPNLASSQVVQDVRDLVRLLLA
jgi:hypothetical protein